MLKIEEECVFFTLLSTHVLERYMRKINRILETSAASHCFIESLFSSVCTSTLIPALVGFSTLRPPLNLARYISTQISLSEWLSNYLLALQ